MSHSTTAPDIDSFVPGRQDWLDGTASCLNQP
jgi:hypothetical protein